ncbi:uncharacterized protein TRUGW13939_11432 [Talaromyces rugulosus]|uniref:Peptidase M48 domain-containing protein n=1 Tax=Talaromyces rugulosus TaxID=121627 RepID=A0A7H8RCV1_TALRU|nr:uncharacterized protein TRUGW13939_11432 [Talaromyces rugulosus]QKX64259.1 hypothetical protein TRUGW13939_11432 [Talaromyces rugulosus]
MAALRGAAAAASSAGRVITSIRPRPFSASSTCSFSTYHCFSEETGLLLSSATTMTTTFGRSRYKYRPNTYAQRNTRCARQRRRLFSSTRGRGEHRDKDYDVNHGSVRWTMAGMVQRRINGIRNVLSSRVVQALIACGLLGYILNLETVEQTGRRRFNIVHPEQEANAGENLYRQYMRTSFRGSILPPNHPQALIVEEVMERLIPHVDLEYADWKVHVIKDDSTANAFVLPSWVSLPSPFKRDGGTDFGRGKVFVYTGLLPIAKDQDGLAVILGHEIAHAVAHHSAERLSSWWIVVAGVTAIVGLFDGSGRITTFFMNFLYQLPNSRTMESEADRIGLRCQTPRRGIEQADVDFLVVMAGLFKQGYQSHDAEDGAVIRNIEACRAISQTVQSSLGPYGRNKIVINHLQKMFLTSDAATILRELDVVHPAAKLLVMASQQQDSEMGDATNLVIVFAGELLKKAEELLRMGLKTSDIVQGYEKAQNVALSVLEDLEVDRLKEMRSQTELSKALRTVIASKQSGSEDALAALVSEAVLAVLPKNPVNFNVDNVRVVKIMGGSLEQSRVIKGMVFGREPDGQIKKARKAKVGVFSCPIDTSQTETKGTVLLKNAQEMLDFTKGEEDRLEEAIKELYDSGLRVVVAGSTVGELALHYLNRFNILVIKILSKFELRRLCRVVGATPLARLGAPMPDEMGSIDVVETTEIGGDRVTVFRQEDANTVTRTATIVLRGATQNHLDDVERAIDDGVNVVKAVTKDPRLIPGAGASEIQLAERVSAFADKTPGLAQYAIKKYAEAFEVVPRTLAESAGLDATEVLSRLYTAHQRTDESSEGSDGSDEGSDESSSSSDDEPYWTTGIDLFSTSTTGTIDAVEEGILDLMVSKNWAIRLATEAARTVLSVDQIIVARQAGGPKPPGQNPNWDED